ncbi:MAG: fluoride efflux transporter CrcB [Ardenticatenaceae bacterium]|nr:fluoride efflux transporter CrcB [Ardenticatenaceae bacterium]
MQPYLAVAAGGAIGATLRFAVAQLALNRWGSNFPWGTLAVNLVGSLLIGLCWQLFEKWQISPNQRVLLFVGIFGGFTTFSSYALESLRLLQEGRLQVGLIYMVGSNLGGLTAVFLGYLIGRLLAR